ncbi:MAG: hypothetical protein CVV10_09105 [Gammaproteobacteria bacterium HGW-Gammaproteobacteria-14]|nr:MAG: hypothetical protein CVV10_09105 [Gammaproteobacteria bacterium HGW-Gammaproteobacteria-14]
MSTISAAAIDLQSDESLIWSLSEFDDHRRAIEFVRHFRDSLCIYSNKVEQIYASYDVIIPSGVDSDLVVVPDLEAFTETWYSIAEKAILSTPYTIVPGGVVGRSGLYLHEAGKGKAVPLAAGLQAVSEEFEKNGDEFLPILTKGDLRAFRKQAPMLHLHRVNCKVMEEKSRFELNDIRTSIRKKLRACC